MCRPPVGLPCLCSFGRLLALALNNGVLVILQQKEEDYCVTYRCSQHNTAYLDCLFLESAPVPLLVAVSLDGLVSVTKCVQGQFQHVVGKDEKERPWGIFYTAEMKQLNERHLCLSAHAML